MMGISQSESKSCLDSWDVAFCIAIVVVFFEAKINCTEAMGPTLMIWDLSCYCFTRPWLGTAGLFDSHVLSSSCHGRSSCWDIGASGRRRFWGWGWAVPTGRVPCLRSEVSSSRRGLLVNISKSYHIISLMNWWILYHCQISSIKTGFKNANLNSCFMISVRVSLIYYDMTIWWYEESGSYKYQYHRLSPYHCGHCGSLIQRAYQNFRPRVFSITVC